jgi:tRNA A22 N-methylase
LTHGYHFRGYKQHPYSIKVNELLKANNHNYEVISLFKIQPKVFEHGKNGEVTKNMFERAKEIFQNDSNYKCVIILGGTNDLAYKLTGEEIFQNLKEIHQFFLNKGIPTVCVTIPENVFVIL